MAASLQILVPVTVGGLIYLLCRPQVLVMFEWADALGVQTILSQCREWMSPLTSYMPLWAKNSLPNGLWAYSLAAFMRAIWIGDARYHLIVPVTAVFIAAVLPEVAQALDLLPGTFDSVDLLLCCCLGAAGLHLIRASHSQGGMYEPRSPNYA